MTASRPLVCRRCGFTNVPGDQFCGSCGAFLEWEGEQVVPDPPVVHADVPAVNGPGDGPAPTTGPVTEPLPVTAGDLVRCPACGIANASSRTFCQSCGARLAEAGRVTSLTDEQIAAAVNTPVTVTTTTIRSTRPVPDTSGGGGVLKWILLMAALGLVVGVGAVLAANALRGDGPGSGATSAPGTPVAGEVSPGPSAEPTASAGTPTDAPTPAATPGPKAQRLALLGASASSVVGDLDRFQPTMAIDGDRATAWQEGNEAEKGEWIEVVFAPSKVTAVIVSNGYNASRALYKGNRRLKDVEIRVGDANPVTVRLRDTGEPQKIDVKNVSGAVAVRITIISTYPGVATSVEGTPFDDAALDEIVVMGIPGG